MPNIEGAASGQVNYQDTTIRERRTDGFDVKLNYQASAKDQLSGRYSFQRPTVFEPSNFANNFGGPYQGGFIGTGVNTTYSLAGNWTRTWTNTLVMDVRAGVSRYHNEALSAGHGLNTATDVGIPGANLDDYTSGMTHIEINNGFSNPVVGYSASLPWDRGETTVDLSTTVTKLWGNHSIKIGGTYRHNKDFLLQTQDQGGPRGIFPFRREPDGPRREHRLTVEHQQCVCRVPAGPAQQRRPRPRRRPGARDEHSAVFTFVNDKWQVSPS